MIALELIGFFGPISFHDSSSQHDIGPDPLGLRDQVLLRTHDPLGPREQVLTNY